MSTLLKLSIRSTRRDQQASQQMELWQTIMRFHAITFNLCARIKLRISMFYGPGKKDYMNRIVPLSTVIHLRWHLNVVQCCRVSITKYQVYDHHLVVCVVCANLDGCVNLHPPVQRFVLMGYTWNVYWHSINFSQKKFQKHGRQMAWDVIEWFMP